MIAQKTPSTAVAAAVDTPARMYLNLRDRRLWLLVALIVMLAATAQFIGPVVIPLGIASITLLPMIWGLLAGGVISGQRIRPIGLDLQQAATAVMGLAVLLLGARLSVTIGPNLPLLLHAGPALLLQEVGHLFGTLVLALPLAVLLRMGPATIGATFSIDRETSFAMVSERYGPNSAPYQGVLSMYIYGTIFGAVIVSLIASLAASLGVFDPLALAMGSGVGSGSMMAAAASVITAAHPHMQSQVLALAATSNLITGVLGLYIGVWVSLPLADRLYKLLTRNRDAILPGRRNDSVEDLDVAATAATVLAKPTTTVKLGTGLLIACGAGVVVAAIASRSFSWMMLLAYAVLAALVLISLGAARLTAGKIPSIAVIVTLGALATSPVSPVAAQLVQVMDSVDFLSVITLLLTIAGLTLGKDLPALRRIGWKIIPVGTVAIAASFLLATVTAELALGLWGR